MRRVLVSLCAALAIFGASAPKVGAVASKKIAVLGLPGPVYSFNAQQAAILGICPSPLQCSRASNATMVNSAGLLAFGPSNVLVNSANVTAWTPNSSGAGTTPTATAGFTDPNGGSTAFRIQASVGVGTLRTDFSIWRGSRAGTIIYGDLHSTWVKSNTGSTQQFVCDYNTARLCTATTTWTRIWFTNAVTGDPFFDIGVEGDNGAKSIDILVWHPQIEDVLNISGTATPGPYNPTTSSAYYGPRFDYTYGSPALLVEAYASANLLLQSSNPGNASWATTTGTGTETDNAATSPDGSTDAATLNSTSNLTKQQNPTVANDSATYTVSTFTKAGTAAQVKLFIGFANGTTAVNCTGTFTFSGASLSVTGGTGCSGGLVQAYGNAYYRISFQAANNSTGNNNMPVAIGVVGAGTANFWGSQVEEQSVLGSYVPTTTAQVSRAADSVTAALASIGFTANSGSIIVDGIYGPAYGAGNMIAGIDNGAATGICLGATSGGSPTVLPRISGVTTGQISVGLWPLLTEGKIGYSWGSGSSALAFDGSSSVSTVAANPTGMTTLRLGTCSPFVSNSAFWIKRVTVYPRPLLLLLLLQKTSANDNFFRPAEDAA